MLQCSSRGSGLGRGTAVGEVADNRGMMNDRTSLANATPVLPLSSRVADRAWRSDRVRR